MRKPASWIAALALTVFAMTVPPSASACSCLGYHSAADQVSQTDIIFRGRAIGTRTSIYGGWTTLRDDFWFALIDGTFLDVRSTQFEILDVWKGGSTKQASVIHLVGQGGNCGTNFDQGETYLIFANKYDDGRYYTGSCAGPHFFLDEDYRAALGMPAELQFQR